MSECATGCLTWFIFFNLDDGGHCGGVWSGRGRVYGSVGCSKISTVMWNLLILYCSNRPLLFHAPYWAFLGVLWALYDIKYSSSLLSLFHYQRAALFDLFLPATLFHVWPGQIEAALSSCLAVLLFISHASPSYASTPPRKVAANLSLQPVPPHRCGILRVQGKGNVSLPALGTLQSVNRACHWQLAGPLWRTISVPSFGALVTTSCNKPGDVACEWGGWVCA